MYDNMTWDDLKIETIEYLEQCRSENRPVDLEMIYPEVKAYLEPMMEGRQCPILPDGRLGYYPMDIIGAFPRRDLPIGDRARSTLYVSLSEWMVDPVVACHIISLADQDEAAVERMRYGVEVAFATPGACGNFFNLPNNAFNHRPIGRLIQDGGLEAVHHVVGWLRSPGRKGSAHRRALEAIAFRRSQSA